MEKYELINDTEKNQYYFEINTDKAIIFYEIKQNEIYFNYVSVPSSLSGKGVGTDLVLQAKKDAESQGFKVIPICGFARYVLINAD